MRKIRKILIANRGEIALRIVRACRELGIDSVAVYSDADRGAPHVLAATEAYRLGPAPSVDSYLRGDLVLEIARKSGADALHPGYGFLSENADFAAACGAAGIKFIGPPAAAMRALGSKTRARQAADAVGMPRVPGSTTGLASLDEAMQVAGEIGYPVMLKAAAGGGGKGMRAVLAPEEMESAYNGARGEAERAFGSSEVYLEKLIQGPRHIEIQVLADEHGNCIHLGERDCSVQRRHQKVIEEAPSPVVSEELREQMGAAAVRLAKSAGYTNAGTVEFLLERGGEGTADPLPLKPTDGLNGAPGGADGSPGKFYFLEMNTRLQVEHPVTELVTGLDLVHLQIAIANGEPLPIAQEDVTIRGHAMECRIYAEDHENGFMPSPGKITRLLQPAGPGIREDSGIYEGWVVPMDYDPMLSKLIAYAPTRAVAIARLRRALEEYAIGGIRTNLGLFRRILADSEFCEGRIDIRYLDRLLAERPSQGELAEGGGEGRIEVLRSAQDDSVLRAGRGGSASQPETAPKRIAAIAAGVFRGLGTASGDGASDVTTTVSSAWKQAARREGLRR